MYLYIISRNGIGITKTTQLTNTKIPTRERLKQAHIETNTHKVKAQLPFIHSALREITQERESPTPALYPKYDYQLYCYPVLQEYNIME
jgi:hypothetical protein